MAGKATESERQLKMNLGQITKLKMKNTGPALKKCLFAGLSAVFGLSSCVYIDEGLGENFIPTDQMYDLYIYEFPLTDIKTEYCDSLSGFSSSRITVGAVRDAANGLSTRSSSFTLIPLAEEMDFGTDPEIIQFHLSAAKDTLSFPNESDANILQNLYVYEITEDLGSKYIYASSGYRMQEDGVIGDKIIAKTVYNGSDSLSFDFSAEFGQKYIDVLKEKFADMDSLDKYTAELPGIYICADEPVGNSGRINMFDLPISVSDNYLVNGNYAQLKFSAEYEGERKDTSFLFYFGAQSLTYSSSVAQYALNLCSHEKFNPDDHQANIAEATEFINIEGGYGPKPVISAKEIRDSLCMHFRLNGVDSSKVIINKASLILPFDDPDFSLKGIFPTMLSPTCRLDSEITSSGGEEETTHSVYYAGLTDASVESENQGDVNWSISNYAPDITHHVQEIIKMSPDADFRNRDMWMLILATETVTQKNDNSEMNDYLQNLAYANYYNNMYGYGNYGYGYGYGYGGYYDYNNYYNYYYLAAMMSNASSESTSTAAQLDKDRYYVCSLHGPKWPGYDDVSIPLSEREIPMMKVTYSVPKR